MSIRKLVGIILLLSTAIELQAQVKGWVVDSLTNEPIPFVQVYYRGTTVGTQTDNNGFYSLPSPSGKKISELVFASIEYGEKSVFLPAGTSRQIDMKMQESAILLKEITVEKRGRYSRKNNPAVDLMRKVIANKKNSDLKRHDFYSYYGYRKMTTSLDNLTPQTLEEGLFKSMPFLKNQVEVDSVTHRMILPILVDETVTRYLYRKDSQTEKHFILGKRNEGINELLSVGEGIAPVIQDVFGNINIYDEDISLLEKRFISPIATHGAISFYQYYIMDTIKVEQDRCIHLTFVPQNNQDFGFIGHLYILADSSYQVRKCAMSLPQNTAVNFVDEIEILQEFQPLPDGGWGIKTDDMRINLSVVKALQAFQIQRVTRYTNYSFEPLEEGLFKRKLKEEVHADAQIQDELFWSQYRVVPLTKKEAGVKRFVNDIKNMPGYKYVIFCAKALIENFVETGTETTPSKFDFGPMNTIFSGNYIDGLRLRVSGKTTAALNPHLFFNGYVAYGTKDGRFKYKGELEYSFHKKKRLPFEFPRRSVALSHQYDVMSPSDRFLSTDKDNMFLSLKASTVDQMSFMRKTIFTYCYESDNSFTTKVELRHINDRPVGKLAYVRNDGTGVNSVHDMTSAEVALILRYAPGETYINSKQGRMEVNRDAPVFSLSHTWGVKGILGGDYNYHATEFSIYKRFWLSSYGRINTFLKGGAVWNKVPFPLLSFPPSNQSYIMQRNAFHLMNNMEFLNDRYASLDVTCELNGVLLNRIPLIRKLKWREVFGVRMLYGGLTDKNNPEINFGDRELFLFPQRDGQPTSFVMKSDLPYIEYHVGVHNVFKILQIEYFRRLTYLNLPNVDKDGIRLMLQFKF